MKKIVPDPPCLLAINPALTFDRALQQAAAHLRSAAEHADTYRPSDPHDNVIESIMTRMHTARSLVEWADRLQREQSTLLA